MLVLDRRPSWLELMFRVRGTVLRTIWPRVVFTAALGVAVTAARLAGLLPTQTITLVPFTLIGLALSIILGFRNTTCYQRFFEGRQLWGRFVNRSRSFARQTLTLLDVPQGSDERTRAELRALQRELVLRTCAYVHAVRYQLRDQRELLPGLSRLVPEDQLADLLLAPNPANAMVHVLGERVAHAQRRGFLDRLHTPILEASLTDFTDIQGGCERIRSTPVPFSYTALIHRIAGFYCLALPFGVVETVGLYTPLVTVFVSYAFFGLDAIGDEIEDPFGLDPHDLPLETISTMIEINLRERLGDADLPAPVKPVDGILS